MPRWSFVSLPAAPLGFFVDAFEDAVAAGDDLRPRGLAVDFAQYPLRGADDVVALVSRVALTDMIMFQR